MDGHNLTECVWRAYVCLISDEGVGLGRVIGGGGGGRVGEWGWG